MIKRFVGDVLFIPHASFHEGQLLHFANLHKKLIISLMFIINILGGRGLMRGDNLRATTKQKKL